MEELGAQAPHDPLASHVEEVASHKGEASAHDSHNDEANDRLVEALVCIAIEAASDGVNDATEKVAAGQYEKRTVTSQTGWCDSTMTTSAASYGMVRLERAEPNKQMVAMMIMHSSGFASASTRVKESFTALRSS